MLAESKGFAQESFQSVAADGRAVFFRNAQPNPCAGELIYVAENQQMLVAAAALASVDTLEIGSAA